LIISLFDIFIFRHFTFGQSRENLSNGDVTQDPVTMSIVAVDFYEKLFEKPDNIIRSHSHTNGPWLVWDNYEEKITPVYLEEVLEIVNHRNKKKSCDADSLCNYMFNFLSISYWCLWLQTFNCSFSEARLPLAWKDLKMLLLAKKEVICPPSLTRPISLLDIYFKN
jgi:hypothetical protein